MDRKLSHCKYIAGVLCVLLALAGCNTSPSEPAGEPIDEAHADYLDIGRVVSAERKDNGVYITARGLYGYHMDENPSVTVGVTISDTGEIQGVEVIDMVAQTEGYDAMITEDYLARVYTGAPAINTLEVDVVAGATLTSKAVQYGVQAAANYAEKVYGIAADTNAEDLAELNAVFPAAYTPIATDYEVDSRAIGTVLFAAEGSAADGTDVVALKVRSALSFDYSGTARTGWEAALPNPYTMIVVIDKATDTVVTWQVQVDGTKEKTYFTVSDARIDAYKTLPITAEDVFDDFTDGLVLDLEYETTSTDDGPVITGTTIIFTGASASGTFSGQLVRQCFRTAAYFYANY